jgi:hypothetical protein
VRIKGKRYLFQLLLLLLLLLALFFLTNPEEIGVGFLLIPVILIFLVIYSCISFLLINVSTLKPRKRFLSAFTVGAGATLLIILSSVGSLTVYDLIVVVLFIMVSAVYIKKSIR